MTRAVRNRYFVCYDVRDPQRLAQTYKTMCGYGDRLQYSVFVCDLNDSEIIIMREALEDVMNMKEDSLVVVNVGPAEKSAARIETVGVSLGTGREASIVV